MIPTADQVNEEVRNSLEKALEWHKFNTPLKPQIDNVKIRARAIRSLASTFIHIIGTEGWNKLIEISDNLIEKEDKK